MEEYINNYGDYSIADLEKMTKDEVRMIFKFLRNEASSNTSKKALIWSIFLHYYVENGEDVPRPIVRQIKIYLKV